MSKEIEVRKRRKDIKRVSYEQFWEKDKSTNATQDIKLQIENNLHFAKGGQSHWKVLTTESATLMRKGYSCLLNARQIAN